MGDEADADWEAGMLEAGIEDTKRWMAEQRMQTRHGIPFKKQKKRGRPLPSEEYS